MQALVLQRWYASQGRYHDIVIGVTAPGAGFHAHAWLDGDEDARFEGFTELARCPPPTRSS